MQEGFGFIDWQALQSFLERGGPAIWAIIALSLLSLALVLWKFWRLVLIGAWHRKKAMRFLKAMGSDQQVDLPNRAGSIRLGFLIAVYESLKKHGKEEAREHISALALQKLTPIRSGVRVLELVATIAPLIGLLGTVLGMIDAFYALEASGARADVSVLAGGIWEALLTTAAGMAVAIFATVAQSYFEALLERVQEDLEYIATIIFMKAG